MPDFCFDQTADHRKDGSYRWEQPAGRSDVIGMETADLDFECPPCVREALRPIVEENTYNYRRLPEGYFRAVEDWYSRTYGLRIEREWLFSVPGTLAAVRLALGLFMKPNSQIILQCPSFGPIRRMISLSGCRVLRNPMKPVRGHFEIDFEDFEQKVREERPAAFVLVNPQDPTGRVFTKQELARLASICARYSVPIISDEVHSLLTYGSHLHTPILAASAEARAVSIQIVSMSKGFNLMGLPHAIVAVASPKLRERFAQASQAHSFGYAVNACAAAAARSVLEGQADDWQRQLRTYLLGNIDLALQFFERELPAVRTYRPEAGFLLWLDCRGLGIRAEKLGEAFMEQAGIRLCNGLDFGPAGGGFVRMNIAVPRAVLEEALGRIKKAFGRPSA
ncbi:MAG: aminotransferase class I/II-fold pyridoxal phosphate-dependent enzyme [Mesosutterella sp.]|nr:aminotransferase class I/II-fold pyridoxal phosphate-dependent enzyme [Mesosutterella sp.]